MTKGVLSVIKGGNPREHRKIHINYGDRERVSGMDVTDKNDKVRLNKTDSLI